MRHNKLSPFRYSIGDYVCNRARGFDFEGTIVTAFYKLQGPKRYVVEDGRGLLVVFCEDEIKKVVIINQ